MAKRSNYFYIGLGSNLDGPVLQIKKALNHIKTTRGIKLIDWSSYYLTAPVGYDDQPVFLNAVAKLKTCLSPFTLLRYLQFIETKQLRRRTSNQNAARTLDLDILLHEKFGYSTHTLTVPHPRMHERRFVLEPLLEIAPTIIIPGRGAAADFVSIVADQDCVRSEQILL